MRRAGRALAAVVALVALAAVVLWSSWRLGPEPSVEATGLSAMWARHQWVGEAHSEQEYDELAAQLRELELTDVFFHVGPLAADGCIPPERYPEADELAAALERRVPEVRVQAWIGQVEVRGGGPLDIGDVSVRERIVGEAERFLELGFDGVHYDIEPWFPGDERYLALLTATREVTQHEEPCCRSRPSRSSRSAVRAVSCVAWSGEGHCGRRGPTHPWRLSSIRWRS